MDQLKEKHIITEQKLHAQIKTTQLMQEKLHQLQSELISKGFTNESSIITSSSTDATYESIIDNLKFIIQEHLSMRNANTQNEIDDLRFRVILSSLFLINKDLKIIP